jgi:hypothetical protein
MPIDFVVIFLPYCMTIIIGISKIVNGIIKTASPIHVPHSYGKGLTKTLTQTQKFNCTSLYHAVRLDIDFIAQGKVPVHTLEHWSYGSIHY